jgi:predicted esterase
MLVALASHRALLALGLLSGATGCAGTSSGGGASDASSGGAGGGHVADASAIGTEDGGVIGSAEAGPVGADDGGAGSASEDASPATQCIVSSPSDITCNHQSTTIGGRTVLWETPLGTPPTGGWPVVVMFQGSLVDPSGSDPFFAPHGAWAVESTDGVLDGIFSAYVMTQLVTQITVIKQLLDNGYAVITPTADAAGFAWDTNFPPWSISWSGAPDDVFLQALFAAIDGAQLGPLSASQWYATGVSSGGYMTSRMAVSYQGRFLALAIAAGSYASCPGGLPACAVPALPTNHPPTLFMHGGEDPLVPIEQMYDYFDALTGGGFTTQAVVDPTMSHGWVPTAPTDVLTWFATH